MRVQPQEDLLGYFWLPESPGNLIPGTLTISNGGTISLEIIGTFDLDFLTDLQNAKMELPRIHGTVEGRGDLTLDDCRYNRKSVSLTGGISKSLIGAKFLVFGAHFPIDQPFEFDSVSFSVDGLDEWMSISGFRVSSDFETKSYQLSFSLPDQEVFSLNEELQIVLCCEGTFPLMPTRSEIRLVQNASIRLNSKSKRPFKDYSPVIFKISTFLSFFLDRTVSLRFVSARSGDFVRKYPDGKEFPIDFSLFYQSIPFESELPTIECRDILATFPQFKSEFGSIIGSWFRAYDEIGPSMHLYFASRSGAHRFIDARFISMAHCLETFHRRTSNSVRMDTAEYEVRVNSIIDNCDKSWREWLKGRLTHGNELSLRNRLAEIIDGIGEGFIGRSEAKQLVNEIVDARNYLTHYSKDLEEKAAKGGKLWSLCMKMEAIFQIHLLKIMGLSSEAIEKLVADSQSIQRKLKEK